MKLILPVVSRTDVGEMRDPLLSRLLGDFVDVEALALQVALDRLAVLDDDASQDDVHGAS